MIIKEETKDFLVKLITVFIGVTSLFLVFDNYLSDKINDKITNKDYIESLSKTLRPFLLFNQNEIITYDHGAEAYIDSIKVFSINPTHLTKIIIYPNQYFQLTPLLEFLGPDIYTYTTKRGTGKIWIYELNQPGFGGAYEAPNKFRLEILK